MEYNIEKIKTPKIEGVEDMALNIADVTQRAIRVQIKKQEEAFEYSLRNFAEPKVKGEITKGKLRWRGIVLIQQQTNNGYKSWIEQRGDRISPVVITEYPKFNVV